MCSEIAQVSLDILSPEEGVVRCSRWREDFEWLFF